MKKSSDPLHRLVKDESVFEKAVRSNFAEDGENGGVAMEEESQESKVDPSNIVDASLLGLEALVNRARDFAEGWDAPYRVEIFRVALNRLLGTGVGRSSDISDAFYGRGTTHSPKDTSAGRGIYPTVGSPQLEKGQSGFAPLGKLSRALNVDLDAVERAVHINEDGRISILGRLEGKGKKELQTRYSLVYLYIKEMALGSRMVDVEELRALCIEQGCYDQGNFTGNYKRDVVAGLMREHGEKGARARRYMLSQKGVTLAADLLREIASQ